MDSFFFIPRESICVYAVINEHRSFRVQILPWFIIYPIREVRSEGSREPGCTDAVSSVFTPKISVETSNPITFQVKPTAAFAVEKPPRKRSQTRSPSLLLYRII